MFNRLLTLSLDQGIKEVCHGPSFVFQHTTSIDGRASKHKRKITMNLFEEKSNFIPTIQIRTTCI